MSDILPLLAKNLAQSGSVLERVFSATRQGAVFGEPVTSGEYTVITVTEVTSVGGVGSGLGYGRAEAEAGAAPPPTGQPGGGGAGMAGGGVAIGRPVAAIVIGPDGVKIKPVIDASKLAIAGITTWGTMLVMVMKMFARDR